jgi:eukaryotic-like serine/threonine-protein kinase
VAGRSVELARRERRARCAGWVTRTRAGRLVVAVAAGAVVTWAGPVPGAAAGPVAHAWARADAAGRRGAAGLSAYDWPELHGNPQLTGYAANGTVSASDADRLGVRWAVDLYSAVLDSPVVAYNSSRGQTLAYIGTDNGNLFALDTATGAIVWAVNLDGPVRASPLVSHGAVWVGTASTPTIYKLNASTGAIECSHATSSVLFSSPVAATPPGGVASVYFATQKGSAAGQVLSISAATCAVRWTFSGYPGVAGTWDPLSYEVDATGEPLVLFGSSNPDDAAYAVDAVTGAKEWRFQTSGIGDFDIGSGLTISPPGANGFASGVAYVPGKDGLVYALNLTTGAKLWVASLGSYGGVPNESLSTAALDGSNLVVGNAAGVSDFNAANGGLRWSYQTPRTTQIVPPGPSEVISSPAISGPAGQEVVAFGDLSGAFRVLSLATGTQLYHYQTGSWIGSSPAVSNGDVLAGSSDGFLYDFSPGAGNQMPVIGINSPARGSTVANSGGTISVSGAASDSAGVAAVVAAVRQGGSGGAWWDAATSSWSATPVTQRATLTSPGATSTSWSVSFPAPPSGNAYRVDAYAASLNGPSAVPAADDEFFVSPAAGEPALTLSHRFAAPGGAVSVNGTGFGPSEAVTISLLGTVVGKATSRADGSLPATKVTLPSTAGFGPTALVATGASSRKAAAAAVYVTSNWPQLGGGPGRTGFEANDAVIQNTIDPGQNILLYPAWHFAAGTALTAPTVVNQVVYVGDQSGTLHALRARDGTQLWSWHSPTGRAITGSPAVDPKAGLAFVGAADGMLYAVLTSGSSAGTLAWSASVGGGNVQSPVFDGTTVYAASAGDAVVARSEATGTSIWSATLARGASAAPALDRTRRILVIPTSAGLTALNASTGSQLWRFPLAGPTSPVLEAGTAYTGSSNHDVYAVSESTGRQIWSFPTTGAIQDSGALGTFGHGPGSTLFIGSAEGELYALDASTGAELYAYAMGSSTRGVAIAGNTVLATTSSGLAEAVRNYGGTLVWSYATGGSALGPPAVVNGTLYAAGLQGTLWAFTPYGAPPL